ncbi:MAG: tRNA (N6-isopentenyl adenosine(37)-C2)-methylthiotransferase MiaB, partial [Elusimicrobia bacterium]|nr:tRNA (N6-isopentenyl adenosine(37)-C2)-methylthiotransferase MiaB [Elusimicrobiota bacterium]
MNTPPSLFTKTFGCQMNFADSDEMGRAFRAQGFVATVDQDAADAVLVNTCTVRDLAEHKASSYLGLLKEWKDARAGRMIVLTGCAAERAKG